MKTQQEVRRRLYYDPIKNELIDAYAMEVLPVGNYGGKKCVMIDGKLYPVNYIIGLYTGIKKARKKGPLNGISFHKPSGRWRLRLTIRGERNEFGYYKTQEEALHARKLIVGY